MPLVSNRVEKIRCTAYEASAPSGLPQFFIFPEPGFALHFGLIGHLQYHSVLAIAKHKISA